MESTKLQATDILRYQWTVSINLRSARTRDVRTTLYSPIFHIECSQSDHNRIASRLALKLRKIGPGQGYTIQASHDSPLDLLGLQYLCHMQLSDQQQLIGPANKDPAEVWANYRPTVDIIAHEQQDGPVQLSTLSRFIEVCVTMTYSSPASYYIAQPARLRRSWQHSFIHPTHILREYADVGIQPMARRFRVPHLTGTADWILIIRHNQRVDDVTQLVSGSELQTRLLLPESVEMGQVNSFGINVRQPCEQPLSNSYETMYFNEIDESFQATNEVEQCGQHTAEPVIVQLIAEGVFINHGPPLHDGAWAVDQRPVAMPSAAAIQLPLEADDSTCTFLVGAAREPVRCHRAMLFAHSPVFRRMFSTDMREGRTGEALLPYGEPAVWQAFAAFCYTAQLPAELPQPIDMATVESLMDVAEAYDVRALRTLCETLMAERLADATCAQSDRAAVANVARLYACDKLLLACEKPTSFDRLARYRPAELSPMLLQRVRRDLLEAGECSDLVLCAEGVEFEVHRFVVEACEAKRFVEHVRHLAVTSGRADLSPVCGQRDLRTIVEHVYWDRSVADHERSDYTELADIVRLLRVCQRLGLERLGADCESQLMVHGGRFALAEIAPLMEMFEITASERLRDWLERQPTHPVRYIRPAELK